MLKLWIYYRWRYDVAPSVTGQRGRTIKLFLYVCVVSEEVNRVSPSSRRHYWHLATLHVCVCEELMYHFIVVISFSEIQHHF